MLVKLNPILWSESMNKSLTPSPTPSFFLFQEWRSDPINSSEIDSNPIRINLRDILESIQVVLSGWKLVVGKWEDVIRKFYKSLKHQRRDAETSHSGVTAWILH